jgi:hypothetical protein
MLGRRRARQGHRERQAQGAGVDGSEAAAGILYAVDASATDVPDPLTADPSIADAIAPAPGPTGACATS